MKIAKRVQQIPPSGIRAFFDLVLGRKDVISLGVGEPDFITPWGIREKAIFSLEKGYTSYTSNKGMRELRQQISHFLKKRHFLNYDSDEEILITNGVSEGLDLAIRSIVNPNDRIIIPEPSYVCYAPMVHLAGGRFVYLNTNFNDGFKIDTKNLDKICRKNKIKGLVINYPSNPTGSSYTKEELKDIGKVANKYDLIVITDEVYDELTYDFSHTPFGSLKGMRPRTIYLNGFSKSYAMTGFRIAYACGPKEIISAMTKIHQYTALCTSIISQMAAGEALKNGSRSVEQMKREYRRRRDFFVDGLEKLGLRCFKPQGAFYVFPSIKTSGYNSLEFSKRLLKKENVAVVPGGAFGPSGEGYVRMSYASSFDSLKEALIRLKHFLNRS